MAETLVEQHIAIGYLLEVLLAEFLFTHTLPKRSHFILRFGIGLLATVLLVSRISLSAWSTPLRRFFLLFAIIAISIAFTCLIYQDRLIHIAPSCIAGIATQHIANKVIFLLTLLPQIDRFNARGLWQPILLEIVVIAVVYLIIYLLIARKFRPEEGNVPSNILSIVIVLTCIGVNRLVADHTGDNIYYELAAGIYAILCCIFALTIQFYLQKWQQERADALVVRGLLSASEKQYEQWKAMVEFTNIQTHDLKHMLDRIEMLADQKNLEIPDISSVRESLNSFAPLIRTGNDVVDVLLRNMDTLCKQQHIRFNCISYTQSLGRFDNMSLYFLFANAIDNARAGAETVSEPEKRLIDVSMKEFGDSLIIHVWNYFDGKITFDNDLPVRRDRAEGHGFGLKSIKMIVDRFEGAMNAHVEGDVFHLDLILPLR